MAGVFEQAFSMDSFKQASDLQKRLLFVLGALFVYRIGTYIPLPGLNPAVIADLASRHLGSGGILGMFNMFSGGALSRMTVFALNLMPYISSSIIIQLFTMISPQLEALKKEGETGRKKIHQYTKYLTVLVAGFQAYGISLYLMHSGSGAVVIGGVFPLIAVPTLICGTLFLVWLGEQITARGVGNGSSLIITVGIIANIPSAIAQTLELGRIGSMSPLVILGLFVMSIALVFIILKVEMAQRRILVQYPKRQVGLRMTSAESSHLPLKVNPTGVIPPIFASALLLLPITIANIWSNNGPEWVQTLSRYLNHGQPLYLALYAFLIVFFAFFYTAVVVNPEETAENLKKHGGFIAGIRPGKNTAEYLDYVVTRLTVLGAFYLAALCILPEILIAKLSVPFVLGGTTLLIVVQVTMDFITQVQSHLSAYQYEGLLKKASLVSKRKK